MYTLYGLGTLESPERSWEPKCKQCGGKEPNGHGTKVYWNENTRNWMTEYERDKIESSL